MGRLINFAQKLRSVMTRLFSTVKLWCKRGACDSKQSHSRSQELQRKVQEHPRESMPLTPTRENNHIRAFLHDRMLCLPNSPGGLRCAELRRRGCVCNANWRRARFKSKLDSNPPTPPKKKKNQYFFSVKAKGSSRCTCAHWIHPLAVFGYPIKIQNLHFRVKNGSRNGRQGALSSTT